MSQQNINGPIYNHAPFNTGDGAELGDTPASIANKLNAMFAELYGGTGTAVDNLTAFAAGGQGGATPVTATINRFTTVGANFASALLPPATSGKRIYIINSGANVMSVYGAGADTVNDVAFFVMMPPNSVDFFACDPAGKWYVEGGVGFAGSLPTQLSLDGLTATGTTQANALVLVADFNRLSSTPAGTGVVLPPAKAGLDIFVMNHGGLPLKVYGSGADTIDDIAGATGVSQMDRSVVLFTCYGNGAYYTEGLATGYSPSGLQTVQALDGITALGNSQATAAPLTGQVNTVSNVAPGTGVNLPASFTGLLVTVVHTGVNPLLIYPAQGAADTINGFAATVGISILPGSEVTFNCTATGAWTASPASTKSAAFNTNAATASTTLTGANITGGTATVDLALTGALAGAANAQLPTVAQMIAAMHSPVVGTSYRLRITNQSSGAFAWTVTTNTGWTVTGTVTIAQNTWREFVVTLNSLTTATIQNVATGTFS
jgi:hypothetical protein